MRILYPNLSVILRIFFDYFHEYKLEVGWNDLTTSANEEHIFKPSMSTVEFLAMVRMVPAPLPSINIADAIFGNSVGLQVQTECRIQANFA